MPYGKALQRLYSTASTSRSTVDPAASAFDLVRHGSVGSRVIASSHASSSFPVGWQGPTSASASHCDADATPIDDAESNQCNSPVRAHSIAEELISVCVSPARHRHPAPCEVTNTHQPEQPASGSSAPVRTVSALRSERIERLCAVSSSSLLVSALLGNRRPPELRRLEQQGH